MGFTAAPFTPEEAARRAQQLLQFLELVPVEYGRGVKGDRVTRDFEITDYAEYARMLGLAAVVMRTPDEIEPGWERALAETRPVLVQAFCDPEVSPLPPHRAP